jgi:hypothetical protein
MENTALRLQKIMNERGLKQTDILKLAEPYCAKYKVKLNKSDLSQFVNGKVVPGQWKLTILGLALNVSEAWLMGLDVPMERENAPVIQDDDERINEFVPLFQQLTDDQQRMIISQIKWFLANQ